MLNHVALRIPHMMHISRAWIVGGLDMGACAAATPGRRAGSGGEGLAAAGGSCAPAAAEAALEELAGEGALNAGGDGADVGGGEAGEAGDGVGRMGVGERGGCC